MAQLYKEAWKYTVSVGRDIESIMSNLSQIGMFILL